MVRRASVAARSTPVPTRSTPGPASYARPSWIASTASLAGILAFTELNFVLAPLGPNDCHAYPFFNAFNFHQTPLRPVHMIYRKWPRDAYHVNLAEGHDHT